MTDIRSRWDLLKEITGRDPEDLDSSCTYRATTIYFRQDTNDETFDIRIPGLTSASQVVVYDNLESAIHAIKSIDTLIDWWHEEQRRSAMGGRSIFQQAMDTPDATISGPGSFDDLSFPPPH